MGLAENPLDLTLGLAPLNIASPCTDPEQDKTKVWRNAEKVEKQCLRESCEGEATAHQDRTINKAIEGRRRRFKQSGRAGLEQVQDMLNMLEESSHDTNTVQATFRCHR